MVTDGEKTDMESPLKQLNLNIYYQLEFGPFLREKKLAWEGLREWHFSRDLPPVIRTVAPSQKSWNKIQHFQAKHPDTNTYINKTNNKGHIVLY